MTTNGAVIWTPTGVTTVTRSISVEKQEETRAFVLAGGGEGKKKDFVYENGVPAEIEAFGRSLVTGKADPRQAPMEAIKDLEILEAILQSGENNGALKKIESFKKWS